MPTDWNEWFNKLSAEHSAMVTGYDGYRVATYREGPFLYAAAVADYGKKLLWRKFTGKKARENCIERLASHGYERASEGEKERRDAIIDNRESLARFAPGTILVYEWGYDQTNIQWYKVMARTGRVLYIQEVASSKSPDSISFGKCVPDTSVLMGQVIKKQITKNGLNMKFGPLKIWDGMPKNYSTLTM